ncbi:flagellin [Clostridium beijerinckii]|uniref:Flagellin n=1 Tax=Clostridium beijerinckii TaxID=1520 RepID=A0AB74VDR2_CLOBE|nr:flagellin [Clostridium beijerinckii]NRZ28828.1 flagellin [Clostridium beijerinckii]NYB95398.1 flagellin [Clostridium beijerinckii]OOM23098.1 flagellin [Clostridium beijerinckii]QUN34500.1 flagellin [Clostridium beijerinckii]SQB00542.1 flagellin [Clostridium beijerinckii]
MRLSHNMFSLSIYKTYKNRIEDNAKALNNVSTGSRLNSAKDNPGKVGKNETLKIQVLTNDAASKNIQDTNSMLQTFDGSLQEINDNLCRLKELAVSAGSDTLTDSDKKIIQNEINSIKADINDLTNNTEFNGIKLSEPSASSLNLNPTKIIKSAIGNMDDENVDIPIFDVSASNLGVSDLDINNIDESLRSIDKATQMVAKIRSKYGSIQNRLEGTSDYLSNKDINVQTAQSRIGDADIAEEMMKYSKSQLLVNSSIGLMAQSNNFPKDCLNILANVK